MKKIERDVILTNMAMHHDPNRRTYMTTDVEGLGLKAMRLELPIEATEELHAAFHAAKRPAFRVTIELVDDDEKPAAEQAPT